MQELQRSIEVRDRVAARLQQRGWGVLKEARIGSMRPDLLVFDPEYVAYVIEIKVSPGEGSMHFAEVAQLAELRQAVDEEIVADDAPLGHTIFATNLQVSDALREIATKLDIDVISEPGGTSALAQAICDRLLRSY